MSTAALDLTTVDAVMRYLGSPDMPDVEKLNVQRCITSASNYWLWKCGKKAIDGKSPFVQPVEFDETYDGSGTPRMFVRNTPLVSISLLQVNGVGIAGSTAFGVRGYFIDNSKKSISLRGGGKFTACDSGGNVRLISMAGFDRTPFDVTDKCTIMVAVNYRRRQWIDQASQAMAQGAGTITFRDWELPPDVLSVMDNYSRNAIVY